MADYTSDRTGANIDTVLDNADAGGIGKTEVSTYSDWNASITTNKFLQGGGAGGSNFPGALSYSPCLNIVRSGNNQAKIGVDTNSGDMYFNATSNAGTTWRSREVYHTGNTGSLNFGTGAPTINGVKIDNALGKVSLLNTGTQLITCVDFRNANASVGTIQTSGTATSFNTSSDPRLKDFKTAPTDTEVNAKFDDLFGCFKTFNWKSDPTGDLVWGFDAHATIDAGLDMGSEGEGSRDLALGEVYKTDEAELDEDGNEIKAAIEHKVSPAGVDQSKAVPILLAKIEQLERRLAALEV